MKNKEIMNITKTDLLNLLLNVEKNQLVNLVTETIVRMNKTNNPYHNKVTKISSRRYLSGNNYPDRVNSNLKKEGLEPNFVSEKPKGKRHVSKCVLIDTKTESTHYFQVEPFEEMKPTTVEYFCEGNTIEKELFQQFMTKSYTSTKQKQDRKVMVITPKVENIKEVSINGQHYIVE